LAAYRVALALHPGTPYANPTRGRHWHGHLDRTADHHPLPGRAWNPDDPHILDIPEVTAPFDRKGEMLSHCAAACFGGW
jgi:hypothetical protein